MIKLGLTGGIASGKSTVAAMLLAYGANLIDADAHAHAVTAPDGGAIAQIRQTFGSDFITAQGALDRKRMRELVFRDPQARLRLQSIIHPLVQTAMWDAALVAVGHCIVFDIPLLPAKSPWLRRLDAVLVVDCSEQTQISRVLVRNGWTEDTVRAVIQAQPTRMQRLHLADLVINNDSESLQQLQVKVGQIANWLGL